MQYDLVFEGGGAKGMVFVGGLQEFEAAGHTHNRLLGTSAGAITASLLAAGYDSGRMLGALEEQEDGRPVFAGFMGVPGPFGDNEIEASAIVAFLNKIDIPLVPDSWEVKASIGIAKGLCKINKFKNLFSFVENGGWYSAARFIDWMTAKLDSGNDGEKTGYGHMTLSQFFVSTERELCLVASDTTAQRMLVLNHRTAPACPLVWAVRMSMSIPLVWPEVEWKKEWGPYLGHDIKGHNIVDGGMLSNFPIELLVSSQPNITAVMGERRSDHVLGFLIDETVEVPGAPPAPTGDGGIHLSKLRTGQRLKALIDTMTNSRDKDVIEVFDDFVVRLPAHGYGTMEFDMSDERRKALIAAGREATKSYFREAEKPKRRPKGPPLSLDKQRAAIADRIASRIFER
jgi:predicted acylesterase/phospholipase RssA